MRHIIVFLLNLLIDLSAQSFCLASYEEHGRGGSYLTYKRLRIEQIELEQPFLLLPNQWNTLPYELFVTSFDHLSFKELSKARLVCKHWSMVAKDNILSVKYHFLKRSYACLVRKIDQNQKIQEYVNKVISNALKGRSFVQLYLTIPDFLHKSLLIPSAIAQILRTPQLIFSLFQSDIKASQIHTALHQPFLDDEQQDTLEDYIKMCPVPPWNKTIFSKNFLNYINFYSSSYKAHYLLALFQLPTDSHLHTLQGMVNHKLSNPQIYAARNEEQALWLPQAMLRLEISPIVNYKISVFCYKWAVNSSNSTLKKAWQEYEEMFLYPAALGNIPKAQFRLGVILYKRGNYRNAELLLRQASKQGDIKAQYALGGILLRQGLYQEAELLLYQAAIKGHLFAHFALAQLWFQQGHLEKASTSFRQVAEQANGKVLYDLAQLLKGNFHREELDLFYHQIVSYALFDHQHTLSTLLLSNNDLKQIDPFYRQVLNHGKTNIQYLLADLLNKSGRPTLAKILLEEITNKQRQGICFNDGINWDNNNIFLPARSHSKGRSRAFK